MEPNTCELQNEFLNDNQLSEYQLNFNESAVKRNVLPKTKSIFQNWHSFFHLIYKKIKNTTTENMHTE
jgi:hypothetical protein